MKEKRCKRCGGYIEGGHERDSTYWCDCSDGGMDMTLIERLEQQALTLERENYHTEAETMREAAKALQKVSEQLLLFV